MRPILTLLSTLLVAAPAAAQYRPADVVPELDSYSLSSLLLGQEGAIERCASSTDASSYVALVRARVSPGSAPSTLYNARIVVDVVSRPRDHEFEGCARRAIRDALRHTPYAVGRTARAQHTFRIAERAPPPIEPPPVAYDEREVQRVLSAYRGSFQRCIEMAGVPEQITLRVAVRPDGRLVLTSADLPTGAARSALGCLSSSVARLQVRGRPARTVTVVHRLSVQSRAY